MSFLSGLTNMLGFDALKDRGKRRQLQHRVYSGDTYLKDIFRDRMIASAYDAQRNFNLCAWMVRKHLDFVSTFRFQSKSGDREFDLQFERFMKNWSKADQCDVRGRHSLPKIIRLAEAQRVLGGDIFIQKLEKGIQKGQINAIEPDLIRQPDKTDPSMIGVFETPDWVEGVKLDRYGKAIKYALTSRENYTAYKFERLLEPENVIHSGYFDRIDQVRGISPLAPALNALTDMYEALDLTQVKVKLAAAFGLVRYRESTDAIPGMKATEDSDGDGVLDSKFEWDVSKPLCMDLGPDDRAEILESKTPATETVAFFQLLMDIIVKALDLPVMFIDESRPNYHGGRASIAIYEYACDQKRVDLIDILDKLTDWRTPMAIADGELVLPAGMQFDELQWEWIPKAIPYFDPQKSIQTQKEAIAAGFDNFYRSAQANGTDFESNVLKNEQAIKFAAEHGIELVTAASTSLSQTEMPDEESDQVEEHDDEEVGSEA